MNPFEYWVVNNKDIKNYMNNYFASGFSTLSANTSKELITDMQYLHDTGSNTEKAMVLTVLALAKLYFG